MIFGAILGLIFGNILWHVLFIKTVTKKCNLTDEEIKERIKKEIK